jgi:hypothetical protein
LIYIYIWCTLPVPKTQDILQLHDLKTVNFDKEKRYIYL